MGRGSSKAGGSGSGGNVVAFHTQKQSQLWDYRGEVERTNTLIDNANNAKSANQMQRAAVSLRNHDQHLTDLIDQEQSGKTDVKGDVDILTTQRRKTRQALRQLRDRF